MNRSTATAPRARLVHPGPAGYAGPLPASVAIADAIGKFREEQS